VSTSSGSSDSGEDYAVDITIDGVHYSQWSEIVEAAKGSTVVYMGYKGDGDRDTWTEDVWGATLKEKYDIDLEYVDDAEIPTLILNDLDNGVDETGGTFDIGWVNGIWFTNAQSEDGWFGPINSVLPNFEKYIDQTDERVSLDGGYPIDGYETPFGSAMMVFYYNSDELSSAPTNCEELLEVAKENPGKITYVDFNDEGGFGRGVMATLVHDIIGDEAYESLSADDPDAVREAVEPVMSYLRDLNPYLWKQGTTFPASESAIDQMFVNGELIMSMSFSPYSVGTKIADGTFPESTKSFVFDSGMCSNYNYLAIPYDAPNKAAALVAINEMLDPDMQLKLFEAAEGTVLDLSTLSSDEEEAFESVDLGPNNLTPEEVQESSIPDLPADVQEIIIQQWLDTVVGKTN
jgi:putative spermidine/putrescine transport system substrate-binding protein